jgi:DNA-binding transcriptional LysR family regulator
MIKELKTFLAVVRYGTFGAAGANIGLTQSAVSAQMQRLEEVLGASLFTRTRHSAILNASGHEAVPLARQIVELFSEMGARVASGELSGALRLGAVQTAQIALLPDALKLLHELHPKVSVRLAQGSSLPLIGQVDSGEIDAALMVAPPFSLPHELLWQPLLREPFVLAVPSTAAKHDWRALLGEYPFIRYDKSSFGGRVVDQFLKKHGLRCEASINAEDVDAMVHLVSRGLGIALVPVTRPDFAPPNVRAVSLGDATFYREIGLVSHAHPERGGLVEVLRDCLHQAALRLENAHPALKERAM